MNIASAILPNSRPRALGIYAYMKCSQSLANFKDGCDDNFNLESGTTTGGIQWIRSQVWLVRLYEAYQSTIARRSRLPRISYLFNAHTIVWRFEIVLTMEKPTGDNLQHYASHTCVSNPPVSTATARAKKTFQGEASLPSVYHLVNRMPLCQTVNRLDWNGIFQLASIHRQHRRLGLNFASVPRWEFLDSGSGDDLLHGLTRFLGLSLPYLLT